MNGSDPRFEYTRNDYLYDQIDYFSERAKFHGSYADDADRIAVLLDSARYDEVVGLEDWQWEAEHYPSPALVAEKLTKYDNADIPIRAYYLSKALQRLLKFSGAPENMIADVTLLLRGYAPKGAEKYAQAQRALIENPGMSITKISEISNLDRSTIHTLIKKGVLVRPD
ncbi:winged helix-turn-helix domain-containing protein [Novosphingobium malaysiense]|uniref:Uncharacterized protein n=1 Tax=Novosphingobium malaysiense TaxID=1348853 RepID=A0A0B1ZSD3_9SPHN|nr:winged helix-turn-helix domain-containing protein [Novosphingobium malaysiense]KHK93556.1 hypothetical protein LK12_04745 [Novosphingobium malaysiense]